MWVPTLLSFPRVQMEKTEKTMAELEIDQNSKFEFDSITEAGSRLKPLSGPGCAANTWTPVPALEPPNVDASPAAPHALTRRGSTTRIAAAHRRSSRLGIVRYIYSIVMLVCAMQPQQTCVRAVMCQTISKGGQGACTRLPCAAAAY